MQKTLVARERHGTKSHGKSGDELKLVAGVGSTAKNQSPYGERYTRPMVNNRSHFKVAPLIESVKKVLRFKARTAHQNLQIQRY